MDIVLALVASLLFALGTVLQQRAGLEKPATGPSSGLLIQMARRPVWLAGIAADAFGFVAQAAALGVGRLAVVQPLLVSSVVFALPLGARLTGQRVHRLDVGAAFLVVAALVAFLTIADPSGGRADAPLGQWLIAGGACALVCVPLVLLGQRGPAPRRAAMLGTASSTTRSTRPNASSPRHACRPAATTRPNPSTTTTSRPSNTAFPPPAASASASTAWSC